MSEQSSLHAYLTWTKQRLDEMDATLASFEAKASHVKADAKARAAQLIADLKKRRKEFGAEAKEHAEANDAALRASKAQLEKLWASFEAQVKTYLETVGKDIEQKRSTFMDIATAQAKAWGEATEKLHSAAAKLAAENRAKADTAIAQMRAEAAEAKARLEKLRHAGDESRAALSAALETSRKAFDAANQKAWDAVKGAASGKS
jgi:hypothetical protein